MANITKRVERIVSERGLSLAQHIRLLRCVAARAIFAENHPEVLENEELLRDDNQVWDALCDLDEEVLRNSD